MRALFALFIRSLRDDSRAKLPPILRTALAVIVLLILWANQRSFTYQTAPGRELLLMVMLLNAGFLAVAAVSIFPSAITEEKEDETLPLLRMTNLNPLSILLGKAAPRFLSAMLLVAVQIPFTLLAITLGGITMTQVLGGYAILVSTAFLLCALALLASVYCRTAIRAGFLTGVLAGIFYLGLPLLGIATALSRMRPGALSAGNGWEAFFKWVMEANPAYGMGMLMERNRTDGIWPVVWPALVGGTIFGLLAWALFDRYCSQSGEAAPSRKKKTTSGKSGRRWIGVPRVGRLPLLWKDYYFMVGGFAGFALRCLLGGGLILLVMALVRLDRSWDSPRYWRNVSEIVLAISAGAAALEVVLLASRIFGVERQKLTLSALVGLPWGLGRIIWQKCLGCLCALVPWILLALTGAALDAHHSLKEISDLFDDFHWKTDGDELAALVYVLIQAVLLLLVIAWFSLRIRRGALPAAAAVLAVWNIIFAIWVDSAGHRSEVDILFAGVFLTVPAILLVSRSVYRRIQVVAAED